MNPLMKYPVFVTEQVLTAKNLNDIVEYLNGQDLSTRRNLIGTGIVCGLDVSSDEKTFVRIGCGCGVTSMGLLINIPEQSLYYYRKYTDMATKPYDEFLKADKTQYGLWELLTQKEYDEADDPDNDFKIEGNADFDLGEMAVLLYLELIDKDLDNCIDEGCDEKGIARLFNLRKLIVKKNDLGKIIARPAGEGHSFTTRQPGEADLFRILYPACSLPSIKPHRLNYNLSDLTGLNLANINTWQKLKNSFLEIIRSDVIKIGNALYESYELYKRELLNLYPAGNPFPGFESRSVDSNQLYNIIESEVSENELNIQYAYDFLCDLVKAYDEFLQGSAIYRSKCCVDPDQFPYHLMLGLTVKSDRKFDRIYRHFWQPSPAVGNMNDMLERLRFLHYKIFQLINSFNLRTFQAPDNIIITPGNFSGWPFSSHSLAHYYSDGKPGMIHKYWNYDLTKRSCEDTILSYFPGLYSSVPFVLRPLLYSLHDYEYFRIEGHIGQEYKSVRARLVQLIKDYNLPFDLLGIKLSADHLDVEVENHCFSDIQTAYRCNRDEYLACVKSLSNLINAFINVISNFKKNNPQVFNVAFNPVSQQLGFISTLQQLFVVLQLYAFYLTRIQVQLPEHIKEFKFEEFRKSYFVVFAFTLICQIYLEYLSNLISGLSAPFLQVMLLKTMFERLLDDCMDSKFKSLYDMYRERLVKLQLGRLFPGYTHGSPGMEHIAGVKEGGTFILVYDLMPAEPAAAEPEPEPEKPEEDICFEEDEAKQLQLTILQYAHVIMNEPVIFDEIKDHPYFFATDRSKDMQTGEATRSEKSADTGAAETENRKEQVTGSNYTYNRVMQLQNQYTTSRAFLEYLFGKAEGAREIKRRYRVVADFAVPFRCCPSCLQIDELPVSDEITDIKFDLEKSKGRDEYVYCNNDSQAYAFTATPKGGVVEGAGVIKHEDGRYYFKPLGLNEGEYLFKYMGKELNAEVLPAQDIKFEYKPGRYNEKDRILPVTFIFTGEITGQVIWNFRDGTQTQYSSEPRLEKIFDLSSQTVFDVTIDIYNENGCLSSYREELDFSRYVSGAGGTTGRTIIAYDYGPMLLATLSGDQIRSRLEEYDYSADEFLLSYNEALEKDNVTDEKKREAFLDGSRNVAIAKEYGTALEETKNTIIRAKEKGDREMTGYLMKVYIGELQQLLATIGALRKDPARNSNLYRILANSEIQLKELKKHSIDINPDGSLKMLAEKSSILLEDKKNTYEIIIKLGKLV